MRWWRLWLRLGACSRVMVLWRLSCWFRGPREGEGHRTRLASFYFAFLYAFAAFVLSSHYTRYTLYASDSVFCRIRQPHIFLSFLGVVIIIVRLLLLHSCALDAREICARALDKPAAFFGRNSVCRWELGHFVFAISRGLMTMEARLSGWIILLVAAGSVDITGRSTTATHASVGSSRKNIQRVAEYSKCDGVVWILDPRWLGAAPGARIGQERGRGVPHAGRGRWISWRKTRLAGRLACAEPTASAGQGRRPVI